MHKKLTITLNADVYDGLHKAIGRGKISQFIECLLRPHVLDVELDGEYKRMAADREREGEALEWSEAFFGESEDAER